MWKRASPIRMKKMKSRSPKAEVLSLLGIAQRAGAVVRGTEGTRHAIRRTEARLLILAEDGSKTQREKILPLAEARGIPWEVLGSMDELGAALGSGPLAALAVTRRRFSREIRRRLGRE